jgi:hypothetical protein|tara:strand:+ start:9477 stop:9608 length:132 start_codon:yes stop_codon:yes gene_type:complete
MSINPKRMAAQLIAVEDRVKKIGWVATGAAVLAVVNLALLFLL